jgi:hypothetical protein
LIRKQLREFVCINLPGAEYSRQVLQAEEGTVALHPLLIVINRGEGRQRLRSLQDGAVGLHFIGVEPDAQQELIIVRWSSRTMLGQNMGGVILADDHERMRA